MCYGNILCTGSTLFWSRTLSGNEWRNPWLRGNSLEAHTAAWGVRAMLAGRLLEEATPVVRYLLQAYLPHDPDPEVVSVLEQGELGTFHHLNITIQLKEVNCDMRDSTSSFGLLCFPHLVNF